MRVDLDPDKHTKVYEGRLMYNFYQWAPNFYNRNNHSGQYNHPFPFVVRNGGCRIANPMTLLPPYM